MIIWILNFLRFFTWIGKRTADRHYDENAVSWGGYYVNHGGYITNQPDLTILTYGKYSFLWDRLVRRTGSGLTADFNSCEVIAVMNALIGLGLEKDASYFPALLRHFEGNHGLILKGYFGTAPAALWKYLKYRHINLEFIRSEKIIEDKSRINNNNQTENNSQEKIKSKVKNNNQVKNNSQTKNNSQIKNNNQTENNIQLENDIQTYRTYIVIFQNSKKDLSRGIHTMCMQVDINGARLLNDYAGNSYYPNELAALKAYNNGEAKVLQLVELTL